MDYPSVTRYIQGIMLPRETKGVLGPLVDPETPVGECEVRMCAAAVADPDAIDFPTERVTREHALRMTAAVQSCHTLVNRVVSSGTGCYKAWSPVNAGTMLDNAGATVPVVADMVCVASFSLGVVAVPGGFKATCILADPDETKPDLEYLYTTNGIPEAVSTALSWIYSGYPLGPGRPGMFSDSSAGSAPVVMPWAPVTTESSGSSPGVVRRALGWIIRWPLAYFFTLLFILGALSAGAHAWLAGVYFEELGDILRGMVLGACVGTALKYTGVYVSSGLTGVAKELGE